MLGNDRRTGSHRIAPNRLESREAGFPMHGMRQRTRRSGESRGISRNVKGLDAVLRVVFVRGIVRATHFHVYFAVVLVAAAIVERIHAEDRGRLQMRSIPHHHDVRSVAKAAVQLYFRAGPLTISFPGES